MLNRCLLTNMLVILALVPATAVALDYWPTTDEDGIYRFSTAGGATMDVVFNSDGAAHQMLESWSQCTAAHEFELVDGSLVLWQRGAMCMGWIDPDVTIFTPAIPMISESMAAGDVWAWEGTANGDPGLIIFSVTAETITVPAGTFDTLRLHADPIMSPIGFEDWWLDRELGPVKMEVMELVSLEDVVAVQARTWSSIKGLF